MSHIFFGTDFTLWLVLVQNRPCRTKKLNKTSHVLGQLCEIVIIDGMHRNDQSSFLVN